MNEMQEKIIRHYRDVVRRMPEYSPTRMAELAPGVVAVEDQAGKCDALFDTEQWQFTMPHIWKRDPESENPLLCSAGLNVLEGVGRFPRVSTIEDMMGFARSNLSPKGAYIWHDTPQFFTA